MSILTRENVVHYCRTCLTNLKKCEGKEEFETRYKIQTTQNLSKWVEDFTSLKILMANDEYPQHICEGCYCIFNTLNEFRILVYQSADKLKDLLEVQKNEPNKISTTIKDDTDSSYQVNQHQNDFKIRSTPATDFEKTAATDALVTPKIEPLENNEADTNSSTFKDDTNSGYQVKNHQNDFKVTSTQATDFEETSATDARQFKMEEEFEAYDTEFISSNINAQEKEKLLSDGSFEEYVELVKEEGVVGGWLQSTSSPTSQTLGTDTDDILFENSKLMQQTFSSTNQSLVLNEPLVTDSDDSTINIIPFQNSIELMQSEKNTDGINASGRHKIGSSDKSSSKHYTNKQNKGPMHQCNICPSRFCTKKILKKHINVHNELGRFVCKICNSRFTQKCRLTYHQRTHTGERPYVCDICNRSFIQSYDLKRHQRSHTGERPYICDICNRAFTQAAILKEHQRIHTGERPYVCDICHRSFIQSYDLKRHQRTHTGERPYVCDVCDRAFIVSHDLKRHQLTHTGEGLYVCDVCNRSFVISSDLKKHQRTHTGERPNVCDICNLSFIRPYTLKRHQRIHTGERPHVCDICQTSFTRLTQLKKHKRSKHEISQNENDQKKKILKK